MEKDRSTAYTLWALFTCVTSALFMSTLAIYTTAGINPFAAIVVITTLALFSAGLWFSSFFLIHKLVEYPFHAEGGLFLILGFPLTAFLTVIFTAIWAHLTETSALGAFLSLPTTAIFGFIIAKMFRF